MSSNPQYDSYVEFLASTLTRYSQNAEFAKMGKNPLKAKYCEDRVVLHCCAIHQDGASRDVLAKLEEMKSTQPEYEDAIDASKLALQAEVYASMLTKLGQNQANAQTHYEWTESGVAIKDAVDIIPNDMLPSVLNNLTVKSEMPIFFASSQAAIANSTAALNIYRQGDFPSQTAEEDAQ